MTKQNAMKAAKMKPVCNYQLGSHGGPEGEEMVRRELEEEDSEGEEDFTADGGIPQHTQILRQLLWRGWYIDIMYSTTSSKILEG